MLSGASIGDKNCYMYFNVRCYTNSKHSYYATLSDYRISEISLVDNRGYMFNGVINIPNVDDRDVPKIINNINPKTFFFRGSEEMIGSLLSSWLIDRIVESDKIIQFCGDKCHLEFSLLYDFIVRHMRCNINDDTFKNIIKNISPCVVDINQEIGYEIKHINKPDNMTIDQFNKNFVPSTVAYSVDREKYIKDIGYNLNDIPTITNEIPNLRKACVTKVIHKNIWNID